MCGRKIKRGLPPLSLLELRILLAELLRLSYVKIICGTAELIWWHFFYFLLVI